MKIGAKLSKSAFKVRGLFPKKLPIGLQEFDAYCDKLFSAYELPNLPSYKQAIASMIMHLGPQTFFKSPRYFAVSVKKAQANEVAYQVLQDINNAMKAKAQAEQAKLNANQEATNSNGEVTPKVNTDAPLVEQQSQQQVSG